MCCGCGIISMECLVSHQLWGVKERGLCRQERSWIFWFWEIDYVRYANNFYVKPCRLQSEAARTFAFQCYNRVVGNWTPSWGILWRYERVTNRCKGHKVLTARTMLDLLCILYIVACFKPCNRLFNIDWHEQGGYTRITTGNLLVMSHCDMSQDPNIIMC